MIHNREKHESSEERVPKRDTPQDKEPVSATYKEDWPMEKESPTTGCKLDISKEKEPVPAKRKVNNSKIKEPAQAMAVEGMLDVSKENKLPFLERNEDILRKRMLCVSNQTEPAPVGYGRDHFISRDSV